MSTYRKRGACLKGDPSVQNRFANYNTLDHTTVKLPLRGDEN